MAEPWVSFFGQNYLRNAAMTMHVFAGAKPSGESPAHWRMLGSVGNGYMTLWRSQLNKDTKREEPEVKAEIDADVQQSE